MIKQIKNAQCLQRLSIKKLVFIVFTLGMLIMPEDLLHLLAVILHTVYESIAFAIEHLLVHKAGFTKFQAQMTVFYTSFALGVLVAIALIRRIPTMVTHSKTLATQKYNQIHADLINGWSRLSSWRKIELMMVELVVMFSMMALLIS